MAFIELDLGKEGFTSIPPGWYVATIEDSEVAHVKEGKNMGKPMIKWTFRIEKPTEVTDTLTNETVQTEGKMLTRFTPAWAGAGGFLASLVAACSAYTNTGNTGFDTKDFHGATLNIHVISELYDGEMRSKIDKWTAV